MRNHWRMVVFCFVLLPFLCRTVLAADPSILQGPGDMKFVLIPAGTFTMGSPAGEPGRDSDEVEHQVMISRSFYLQTREVTQGQWRRVMGENPSYFKNCGDACPVEQVSWRDVENFIRKLNEQEGTGRIGLTMTHNSEVLHKARTALNA